MKRAFTDYPFVSLGDIEHTPAPIREIKIISYDGNKYVKIEVEGEIEEIKVGYIYKERGRYGEVPFMQFPRKCIGDYYD